MEIYIDIELHCQYTTAPPSEIIIIVYDGGSWIGTMSSLLVRHLINLFLFLSRFSLLFFFFFGRSELTDLPATDLSSSPTLSRIRGEEIEVATE